MPDKAILCIDDEKLVLNSLKAQLKKHFGGVYSLEFAESADEGLELIDEVFEEATEVLLVISDWLMPGMKGDEFLKEVHKKHPNIVKLMLTGQAAPDAIERARHDAGLFRLLNKPWEEEDLIRAVKDGLGIKD